MSYKKSDQSSFTVLLQLTEAQIGGGSFGECGLRLTSGQWYSDPGEPDKNYSAYFDNLTVNENYGTTGWTYASSGTWRSEVDGGVADAGKMMWRSLTWEAGNKPGGTSVVFQARACTGSDGAGTCSAWQTSADLSVGGSFNLDPAALGYYRYLQVEVELGSDSSHSATPRIGQMSLEYEADNTPPGNPTDVIETHGVSDDVWQNDVGNPNFTWSGADDAGGSGVAGYEVYWGTSSSGTSPATWTTTAGYDPPAVPSNSIYYLRVRTRDQVGNWAGWETLFTFRYDITAPNNPTWANPGCDAIHEVWQNTCNDPNFTWGGASDPGGNGVAGYRVYWGTSESGTTPATWRSSASYNPAAVPSNSTYYLRVRTQDQAGNWAGWEILFTLRYDNQPPLISDLAPPNGSVVNTAWPTISAALSDPSTGSGVDPQMATLTVDGEAVTPQVNTAEGFEYTPETGLADGSHPVTAQVYDRAGNQAQTGPWTFSVDTQNAPSLAAQVVVLGHAQPTDFTFTGQRADAYIKRGYVSR